MRLDLLKETLYNVSFSVLISVKALMVLFFSTILFLKINVIDNLLDVLISNDLNYLIQFILGFFLYKYTISIFLVLYMILKRINVLYIKEIEIEHIKLEKLKREELEREELEREESDIADLYPFH